MKKAFTIKLMNYWPPFLGAGIRVTKVGADYRLVEVEMKLRPWNSNYVGTHFGGSLYMMADPFYMFKVIENLGRDYIVWDKAAGESARQGLRTIINVPQPTEPTPERTT